MKEYIKLDFETTYGLAKITCQNRLFGLIRESFSVPDPAAKARARFSRRKFPTRKYAITPNGRFKLGLVSEIINLLRRHKIDFELELTDQFKEEYNTKFDFYLNDGFKIQELNLKPRDYQMDGIRNALKFGSGTFVFPTGSGKTLLIATTIHNILANNPKAKIFVVTLTHLVNQFVNDFVSYGMNPDKISPWTGETGFHENQIVVAGNAIVSTQLVDCKKEIPKLKQAVKIAQKRLADANRMSPKDVATVAKIYSSAVEDLEKCEAKADLNKKVLKYFNSVYALFIDEVHQCKKGNVISDVTNFVPTKHKFGYTGTLPEDKIDEWNVIGSIGPVRQIVERNKLEDVAITPVQINEIEIHYKDAPSYKTVDVVSPNQLLENYQIECDFLYGSAYRNKVITHIASKVSKNILIVVDRIEHGQTLTSMISEACPNKIVRFMCGEVVEDERKQILDLVESNDNVVVVAIAKVVSTGINVHRLFYLMPVLLTKALVTIVQSIGRGVRLCEGKDKLTVFDLHDVMKYASKHFDKRKIIYENEGFTIKTTKIEEK